MPRVMRIREEEESSTGTMLAGLTLGALAGFAVGVLVAQKSGGVAGLAARLRRRWEELEDEETAEAAAAEGEEEEGEEGEERENELVENDELEEEEAFGTTETVLEEQVLEAFRGDPVLRERAIDIGAVGEGVIELSGWVDSDDESEHAETTARHVAGVESVVNRIVVGRADEEAAEEPEADRPARRGDAHWRERPRPDA